MQSRSCSSRENQTCDPNMNQTHQGSQTCDPCVSRTHCVSSVKKIRRTPGSNINADEFEMTKELFDRLKALDKNYLMPMKLMLNNMSLLIQVSTLMVQMLLCI